MPGGMTTQIEQQLHPASESIEVEAIDSDVVRPFPQRRPLPPEPATGASPAGSPKLWEYKAALGGSGSADAETALNVLGAEGWELVSVVPPHGGAGQTVLYMKREQRS